MKRNFVVVTFTELINFIQKNVYHRILVQILTWKVFLIEIIKEFFSFSYKKGANKKKCSVVLVSIPQSQRGTQYPCNYGRICLCKWLSFNRSLVTSLASVVSSTKNNDLSCKEKDLINTDLKNLMFTDFFIMLSSLFHSLMQKSKKKHSPSTNSFHFVKIRRSSYLRRAIIKI